MHSIQRYYYLHGHIILRLHPNFKMCSLTFSDFIRPFQRSEEPRFLCNHRFFLGLSLILSAIPIRFQFVTIKYLRILDDSPGIFQILEPLKTSRMLAILHHVFFSENGQRRRRRCVSKIVESSARVRSNVENGNVFDR